MATPNLTYLFFDTKDYSGTSVLSSYSLSITPLTFVPDFTTSTLLSGDAVISNKKIVWNFGDGNYSNSLTAVHQFKWPGQYKVKLTIFDNNGNAFDSSYQPIIYIHDFVNDQIAFADFKRYIYDVPASKIIDPLVIRRQNSWQSYNALSATGYTINLYASGASGDYIDLNNYYNDKWSHLRSNSRFYEIQEVGDNLEYVIVDSVVTKDKEIFAKVNGNKQLVICDKEDQGSCFAGTTGYAEFYYVDDRVKNFTSRENPIFVFATIDSSKFQDKFTINRDLFNFIEYPPAGFQNLQPAVLPIIKVRHNPATKLTITTTGIDGEGFLSATNFNIPYISWQHTNVPFVVKMKDEDNFTTKTYPPLSSSQIETGTPSTTAYDLKVGILYYDTNTSTFRELTGITFNSDFSPDIPRNIGAFYKGYFSSDKVAYSCKLTASMVVADPNNYPKDSVVGWISEPQYMFVKRFLRTQIYDFCKGHVTLTLSAIRNDFGTPECPESYCIAVAPSGAEFREDYMTWIGDGSADKIYKIDILGNILSAFSLSSYPVETSSGLQYFNMLSPILSSAAPNSISINKVGDAWVSLFDSTSVIKINRISGHVTDICYPHYQNLVYYLSSDYNLPQLSGFAGENSLLPASIDTDYFDNLWVAYTHPASNFLVKYDNLGLMLSAIPLNKCVSPVEIVVDRDQNIWLTAYNLTLSGSTLSARNDFVYKFTPTGTVCTNFPITGFRLVGNITVDSLQNAWVFQDRETITKIDRQGLYTANYVGGSGNNITTYEQSIGGIAMDTSDYLWVINSIDKKMYFIDSYLTTLTSVSGINMVDLDYPPESPLNPASAFTDKRFQAYGDWLGSRWINKYMIPVAVVRTLTGESQLFNIYPYEGEYNITKINENFDANNFYNDLRYQEVLLDKTVFFDQFLGTIVGKTSAQPYELGKTIFEKISNYVSNNSDIDKCNLEKLISFCNELSVQFEEYNYPFPPQLRRLVDLLTIKHKILFGETNKFVYDFDKKGTSNPNIGKNIGTEINVLTGTIQCGVPIIAFEIFSDLYSLVNISKIEGYNFNQIIPLSSYNYDWGWGLVAPKSLSGILIKNYYRFFTFNNIEQGDHYNNIINWNDPLTLLPFSLSGYTDWSKNDGIMQNMLSYELTKGLKLFLSGTNITYNN